MTKEKLLQITSDYITDSPANSLPGRQDTRMYEAPLIGYASTEDPYFEQLKAPDVIGPQYRGPKEWLPAARTVITMFFPFTRYVRDDNRKNMALPSEAWLLSRIEGQQMIVQLTKKIMQILEQEGHQAVAPAIDKSFTYREAPDSPLYIISNWSERHAAYACGLGTFGLSKGLITTKGVAGRYSTIVTTLALEPDPRTYSGIYDYCSMCGACARNCPAEAISLEKGKDHRKCSQFLDMTMKKFAPRYGCGKCQINVPCETKSCSSDRR